MTLNPSEVQQVYTRDEAATFLGMCRKSFDGFMKAGRGPACYKHGTRDRFTRASLMDWLAARESPAPDEAKAVVAGRVPLLSDGRAFDATIPASGAHPALTFTFRPALAEDVYGVEIAGGG